jgi:hypothetical protein
MSMNTQQYANLASDAYNQRKAKEVVTLEGVKYEVIEHFENPRNSYQGTIYRRIDTEEIVVAHRGTEMKNIPGVVLDLAYTDGSMVLSKVNPQAEDAIQLTRRALEFSEREGRLTGHMPEVSVTGHSLGGTLAQITAHHFDLRGEAFNPYGAASLGMRIPEGGNKMLNHVMAADLVSSAAPHYGQVKIYAEQKEMDMLGRFGYDNDRQGLGDLRAKGAAPFATIGSHFMSHFMHGEGSKNQSILADPSAQARVEKYDAMIDKFRDDVRWQRGAFTALGQASSYLLGNREPAEREPLAAGEPALRAGHVKEHVVVPPLPAYFREGFPEPARDSRAMPSTESAPKTDRLETERLVIPPLPEYMREPSASRSTVDTSRQTAALQLNDSLHPDNAMFRQILSGVHDEDRKRGREPDPLSEQVAAGLTVDAKARGLNSVGFFQFSADGSKAYMTDTRDPSSEFARTAAGDVGRAAQQSIASSSDKAADINQSLALTTQQTLLAQQLTPQPNPDDPGRGPRTM